MEKITMNEPSKNKFWWTLPLLIISLIGNIYLFVENRRLDLRGEKLKVTEVIDGSTIRVGDQEIKLSNIQAPDLTLCLGLESKQKLQELVLGKYVEIEKMNNDLYGDISAFIYTESECVNEELLKSGLVRYQQGLSLKSKQMQEAEGYAKRNVIGIWSNQCYQENNKENSLCNIKGNTEKNTDEKVYHLPKCQNYEKIIVELDLGERWFCSEAAAQKAKYRLAADCY